MLTITQYQQLFQYETFVVLDIETTGLSPQKGGRIIEIGAVRVEGGQIVDEFSAFIYPEMKVSAKTTQLTGITHDMVKDAPTFHSVLADFQRFIQGAVIVAHNSPFDWDRFLVPYFQKIGYFNPHHVLDTRTLFKHLYPSLKKENLALMCETLEVANENHHRANNDARVTAICFLKMREVIATQLPEELTTVEALSLPVFDSYPKESTRIKSVNPWSKQITKKNVLERVYVRLYDRGISGTVFYDQNVKVWENKDFPANLDFKALEPLVLAHLNLGTSEELCGVKALT